MYFRKKIVWIVGLCSLLGCDTRNSGVTTRTGMIPVQGGKIWYQWKGPSDGLPIVLLHGGPGFPAYYLKPLQALSGQRPVLLYDQLGCGRSEKVRDSSLYELPVLVDQLHTLLDSLGIRRFHLYGHSFGTVVALAYYHKYPEVVQSLILASPALSPKRWERDADTLIAGLPEPHRSALEAVAAGRRVDTAVAGKAMDAYFAAYYDRTRTPDKDSAIRTADAAAALYMWGPTEFRISGRFKNFDAARLLPTVRVPVLFECGEFDPARPVTVRYYQSLTPGAKLAIIKGAGHTTMADDPSGDLALLRSFLDSVEKKR